MTAVWPLCIIRPYPASTNPEGERHAEAPSRELVIVMTHGIDSELSSVGFTLARGGLTAGMKVCVFLTSSAVDLARRRGAELTHVQPLEPLKAQMEDFVARGGVILACPPCVKSRGYTQEDLHTDRGGLRLVSVVADHGPAAVEPNRATVLESRGENLPFGSRKGERPGFSHACGLMRRARRRVRRLSPYMVATRAGSSFGFCDAAGLIGLARNAQAALGQKEPRASPALGSIGIVFPS